LAHVKMLDWWWKGIYQSSYHINDISMINPSLASPFFTNVSFWQSVPQIFWQVWWEYIYIILYKYVIITYIFKNKFKRWIFHFFFQWKHMTSFIHNCNLQTTINERIFFHFHFGKYSYKNSYKLSNHNNQRF